MPRKQVALSQMSPAQVSPAQPSPGQGSLGAAAAPVPGLRPELQRAVAALAMFAHLDEASLNQLAAGCRQRRLARNEVLFRQGDPSHGFYLVQQGQIHLAVTPSPDARKVVKVIDAGGTFAEATVFAGIPYPVTASASQDSLLLLIPARTVLELVDTNPSVARQMLATMSLRLHALVRDAETATLNSATARVAHWLLQQVPTAPAGPVTVVLGTSKNVLASRLNLTPEALSRALRRLADAAEIEVRGRSVAILAPERLAARAQ